MRLDGDGGVVHPVTGLDPLNGVDDDIDGDVLRNDGESPAAGDRLGHALAGDRRHIGDDERDGGAGGVVGGQVHVRATAHARARGHHEDVVVCQIEGRHETVEELHAVSLTLNIVTETLSPPSGGGASPIKKR
jgi:hypothetical protein